MISPLSARTWESKSALQAQLDERNARTLMVGLDAEAPRAYYSFSVDSNHGKGEIGVIASGHGVSAAAVLMDGGRRVLVGHDSWLTWVDMETLATFASRRLGGIFFEFLSVDHDEGTVVLHELGALRVDGSGAVKWSIDTDVVEDSTTDGNGNLILSQMDGPKLVVSLVSGAVLR
jgi:hypothetical protein